MSKIIFFALLFVLIFYVLKRKLGRTQKRDDQVTPKFRTEEMVPCVRCGLHVPRTEALLHNRKFYCCENHIESK